MLDVDLVARDIDVVLPSVTTDFLISHYHDRHPGYPKFLVQLVDRVTHLRIDIFPDQTSAMSRAVTFELGGVAWPVVDAETIFNHKLATVQNATADAPADPKHLRDIMALAALLGRPEPKMRTRYLADDRYSADVTACCRRCEMSRRPQFPLASKTVILQMLGYV